MKKLLPFGIVLLFGVLAIADLLHPGFAVTHDGQDHIARIANFYQNLAQGIIIPRWAANLNWGYGHPILEFLYPLPSYIASLFHFTGLSFIDSTKLVFALGMIFSGIAMYFFAAALWGETAGIIAGILYMYAPYRFIDLYVRGDIGEHVAFVFVPLVFWGLYKLFQTVKKRYMLLSALFLALLILSHNAISLMVMPLIFLYALFLLWRKKWNKIFLVQISTIFILGFLLSAFFWVPALIEGQYTLRNIVTKGGYITRFVTFPQLLYGPWNYGQTGMFTVQLGIFHWIFLLVGFILSFYLWRKSKADSLFVWGLTLATAIAIFLMLPVSDFFWSRIMLLQNFQFPWRFLAIPVFTTSLIAGYSMSKVSKKYKSLLTVGILLIVLFISKEYMHAKAYSVKPESFFTGIYNSTTDTGESSPIWSVRFMGSRFAAPLENISGIAQITQRKRLVTVHEYAVNASTQTDLLENTLYFPGWKVFVDGKNVSVQFQDAHHRGLMTFTVPKGIHAVVVAYSESKVRIIGDILTVIALGVFIFLGIQLVRKRDL